ncbi:MAG TPA: recombinase family protein [Solirubrobacteraceae bacterium]|nr:recombinase family protein [Solirubrobacteraceae bacterium]
MQRKRRAIGIIRVSRVNGREGESFASPGEQRDRLEAACERDGLELLRVEEELDVSGGTPLQDRAGLLAAVEAVEAGKADVIVAAYFDRLVRSLKVQGEIVQRVEAAGGSVLAVDIGQVSGATASQWLSGTLLGAVSEYQRRTTGERARAAQARAVARGVPPLASIPPGYRRGPDGRLVVERREAPVVAEAFRMRAGGATLRQVCAYLREHGIARTVRSTQTMLASPVMLGQIHFGELVNLEAHEPIVDAETFRRAQNISVPRGRKAKSDRLLARLGVLRCATCGGRMSVGSRNKPIKSTGEVGRYPMYRCSPTGDCPRRAAISAELAEQTVTDWVRAAVADVEGRASAEANIREAEAELQRAEDALNAAVKMLTGLEDVDGTREKLAELRGARDAAADQLDRLGGARVAATVNPSTDWNKLTRDEQRAFIRATIKSASVRPGRGPERIEITAA